MDTKKRWSMTVLFILGLALEVKYVKICAIWSHD
jgi:hypothetical protein